MAEKNVETCWPQGCGSRLSCLEPGGKLANPIADILVRQCW